MTGTEAAPASVGNLRTMFSACMDTETIETAGLHNILAEWFGPMVAMVYVLMWPTLL